MLRSPIWTSRPHRVALWALTIVAVGIGSARVPRAQALPPLWKQLMPQKRVAADPQGDYRLKEDHGPWLVLAKSFDGAEGEAEALELTLELREKFNMAAYLYSHTFVLGEERPGRGVDVAGGAIKRRYRRGDKVQQHAVLVGDFASIEGVDAQETLEKIKVIHPASLEVKEGESTAQSLAAVRQFYQKVKEKSGRKENKGPMGHAFMVSNPLLPTEYFAPQGPDPDIVQANKPVEHSLLKCPGKYSVRVATFRGRTSLKEAQDLDKVDRRVRQAKGDDPLVTAGLNAHKLVVALRAKGWEAYEMHDRFESYVTVGSFDEGRRLADGRIVLDDPNAQKIMHLFSAFSPEISFSSPDVVRQTEAKEQQTKQRFNHVFSQGYGRTVEGLNPKRFAGIPFDIQPQAIEVPHPSVSAALARK